ncbi:MAG: TonB-dependent receptor [Prevotella sp.]|nr:TonB-dependent receptor [Prevotella sp.]
MKKQRFNKRERLLFKHFTNKGYALFSCLGKEVIIGVLSVSTLTYAKADGISTQTALADDSLSREERTLDEVIVTGSRTPLTQLQSAAIVRVINRDEIDRAAATTVNDVLKIATGVDVRQRGGFGVQTDISIGGGTFDQITLLLNGINISNPQTGHNAADFPISLNDIERIEILEGAASRVLGTSAFCGAINIVTRAETRTDTECVGTRRAALSSGQTRNVGAWAELSAGSFGTMETGIGIYLSGTRIQHRISGGYARSDGGTLHSDFEKVRLFYNGKLTGSLADLNWQIGGNKKNYGANTFYSAKYDNQYERTEHELASVKADLHGLATGLNIRPAIYYNRFTDHYQLIRGEGGAAKGENYHSLNVVGASTDVSLRWTAGTTTLGFDLQHDHIMSTAYGNLIEENKRKSIHGSERQYDHEASRTNTSLYVEHSIVAAGLTLSAGLLANRNSGLDSRFRLYPGIDASFRPNRHWKVFASWNMALRMPTYTDLYIKNAVQQGDIGLEPERNTTLKLGGLYRIKNTDVMASTFYSRGRDMIDWVYETAESTRYKALNLGKLNNMGFSIETSGHFYLSQSEVDKRIHYKLGYAFIHQHHETNEQIYRSLYALEYLRHKLTAQMEHPVWSHLSASWTLRWQQRMNGYHPYTKIDAKLCWTTPHYNIYMQADNLTGHRYYDLSGVRQPGLWLMAGCIVNLSFRPHAQ